MGYFDDALSVVLADDHHFFREGLRAMLEDGGMRVVAEAADGPRAVALAREHRPDVLVLDLGLPGCSGIEALRELVSVEPRMRVLVLTASTDERDVRTALAAGACGYLLKDTRADCLVGAVRQAAEGHMVLSREVGGQLTEQMGTGAEGRAVGDRTGVDRAGDDMDEAALTPREREVLRLIAGGFDNKTIGNELAISHNTVKQYVTNIFEKLGVRSRVQAAVHAVRVGIV